MYVPTNPLIVQSDRTLLLEVDNPLAESCRDRLSIFCDLVKSPEHIHTYRMTPLSLWNARTGVTTHRSNHPGPVTAIEFSPDGAHLLVGTMSGRVRVLQVASMPEVICD